MCGVRVEVCADVFLCVCANLKWNELEMSVLHLIWNESEWFDEFSYVLDMFNACACRHAQIEPLDPPDLEMNVPTGMTIKLIKLFHLSRLSAGTRMFLCGPLFLNSVVTHVSRNSMMFQLRWRSVDHALLTGFLHMSLVIQWFVGWHGALLTTHCSLHFCTCL